MITVLINNYELATALLQIACILTCHLFLLNNWLIILYFPPDGISRQFTVTSVITHQFFSVKIFQLRWDLVLAKGRAEDPGQEQWCHVHNCQWNLHDLILAINFSRIKTINSLLISRPLNAVFPILSFRHFFLLTLNFFSYIESYNLYFSKWKILSIG